MSLQICSDLLLSSARCYRFTAFRYIINLEGETMPAAEIAEKKPAKPKLEVSIAYNGMNGSFKYTAKKKVGAIREQALDHYNITGAEREENILFGPDNQTELPDGEQMGSVVEPGSQLYLRRRAAGGGWS
jgi:hypothetical protein